MGYDDDELKPFIELPKDMRDEKRVQKLQNIGYNIQQITDALDRERFEEIHATYLLLKEKKSNEADINGITPVGSGSVDIGKGNSVSGENANASAGANSSQYPRSLSAQVNSEMKFYYLNLYYLTSLGYNLKSFASFFSRTTSYTPTSFRTYAAGSVHAAAATTTTVVANICRSSIFSTKPF